MNKRDYGLALINLDDFSSNLEQFLKATKVENRCDGLLVLGERFKDEESELLRLLRIPSATVESSALLTRPDADGIKTGAEAIRQLFAWVVSPKDDQRRNIAAVSRGSLEAGALEGIDRAWRDVGSDWAAST